MIWPRSCALAATLTLAGCSAAPGPGPSLAPRSAESIDPRVPVVRSVVERPADPALTGRLAELVRAARQGEGAFAVASGQAERLTAAAGARQTESWIVAQQALSAAVAARAPATRALADVDAIAAEALARQRGIAPADLAAIEAAAREIGAVDRRQAEIIDRLQARLGG
jgi:GNAT superfamily N-acetyltransferase